MVLNRIDKRFADLKQKKQAAAIAYVMAGHPSLSVTSEALEILVKNDFDIIEVGFPFSDPAADGPIIQAAGKCALQNNVTLSSTLGVVQNFRIKNTDTPIILMGYYNPIFQYGEAEFIKQCVLCGVDGLIVPDLPLEECAEFAELCKNNGICLIQIISQLTDVDRLKKINKLASGFIYFVSILGITGTKTPEFENLRKHIDGIRKYITLPLVVGFGIKTPAHAKNIAAIADGFVVGSALVSELDGVENGKLDNFANLAKEFSRRVE